ncbi:MAG: hypothetical protein IKF16_11905 [Lachnospiraceae bacterium]|nr:hypothetical protein [Lachnospiraceae bacterium]
MYPNLMGQKAYHNLTSDDMGAIIGVSRQSYEAKMKSGRFTPAECKAFCEKFNKSFDFLFATDAEAEALRKEA